jgi:hypothetical protein
MVFGCGRRNRSFVVHSRHPCVGEDPAFENMDTRLRGYDDVFF